MVPIFEGLSLEVPPRHVLRIVGPNGSGKSTLLDLISGRLKPAAGTISLNGTPLRVPSSRLAYLRQKPIENVAPSLTVAENLVFADSVRPGAHHLGRLISRRLSGIENRLGTFGVSVANLRRDQSVGSLSGGQMQWLGLAMAILSAPEILLLDEPTAFLDATHSAEFFEVILEYRRQAGCIMILVCHGDLTANMTAAENLLEHHV
jgi:ABC-type multidrug transport system ATPase subunit